MPSETRIGRSGRLCPVWPRFGAKPRTFLDSEFVLCVVGLPRRVDRVFSERMVPQGRRRKYTGFAVMGSGTTALSPLVTGTALTADQEPEAKSVAD